MASQIHVTESYDLLMSLETRRHETSREIADMMHATALYDIRCIGNIKHHNTQSCPFSTNPSHIASPIFPLRTMDSLIHRYVLYTAPWVHSLCFLTCIIIYIGISIISISALILANTKYMFMLAHGNMHIYHSSLCV